MIPSVCECVCFLVVCRSMHMRFIYMLVHNHHAKWDVGQWSETGIKRSAATMRAVILVKCDLC